MSIVLVPKPLLDEFITTCTPLAIIESLESEMRQRLESISAALLGFSAIADPVENLTRFLQTDENFLGIVLALTNLSQEKFLRILSAERFAIPEPSIFIMTSYMETTSSGQTARANEQSEMYGVIQKENRRYGSQRVMVNFIDGAGWLARRTDLRKLYDGCDYIINLKTLDRLEAIICKYVPDKYFTTMPKP